MLKYLRYYLINLIRENPVKFTAFLISMGFYWIINLIQVVETPTTIQYTEINWADTTQKKIVYLDNKGVYSFYDYSDQSDFEYNSVTKTLTIKFIDIKNDFLKILYQVIYFIIILFLIITLIVEMVSDEIEFFDYRNVHRKTLQQLIQMDEENGIRYYHLQGRLLYEDHKNNYYHISNIRDLRAYLENYIENPKVFPRWLGTTSQKRDSILTQLLTK